ncbi:uncharacterized protein [Dermacentor albipictus]|uniref:uncharacterized protein n=1 Tax=Dermacentor albipictus TaxID=60249 RepID=UPI0038FCD794
MSSSSGKNLEGDTVKHTTPSQDGASPSAAEVTPAAGHLDGQPPASASAPAGTTGASPSAAEVTPATGHLDEQPPASASAPAGTTGASPSAAEVTPAAGHLDDQPPASASAPAGTTGASPSAAEVTPAASLRDDQPPASPSASTADPKGTADTKKLDERKPGSQPSKSEATQPSLHSLELTAGLSSSLPYQQSGPLSPPRGMSKSRVDVISEATQTEDSSIGGYRSLILQYSPSRGSQEGSSSRLTSPGGSQGPLSSKSMASPPLRHRFPGVIESRTPSVTSGARTWPSTLSPGGADPVQPKQVHSEGLLTHMAEREIIAAERTRSMAMQVSSERHSLASPSPRAVVPWTGSPWKLVGRSVDDIVKNLSSPQSPTSDAGRQEADDNLAAALSAEAAEFEDTFAIPQFPWVTLAVMWLVAQSHWKFLHKHYPERCASAAAIVHEGHWWRIAFAAFHHVDFTHLAANLLAFFVKGIVLEAALGIYYFAVVFAVAVFAVGLVNTAAIEIAYAIARQSSLHSMCSHTFAGVIAALGVINYKCFSASTIHYKKYELAACSDMPVLPLYDLAVMYWSSNGELLPIVSGLLVGLIMVAVIRIPYPRRHLYLIAVPMTPVTYAFMSAVVAAYLYGPYTEPCALGEAPLTFKVPVWRPFMLPPLYVGNIYQLAYVLLTVFTVGRRLERDLGRCRLALLAPLLLFAVSVLRDGLRFIAWKYQLAFWSTAPPPAPHSGECCCGLVGTLLALKAIHHSLQPDAAYRLGTLCIRVRFWPGLLLELTHFLLLAREGSTFGHVTGVLLGLVVSHLLRDRRWFDPHSSTTGSSSALGSSREYEKSPAPGLH